MSLAIIPQESLDFQSDGGAPALLYVALPNGKDSPAARFKRCGHPLVASHVARKLGGPEFSAGCRVVSEAAIGMAMPEASVDEYNALEPWKDEIRFPRQVTRMKPVPQPQTVQRPAKGHLGFGVLPLYAGHDPGSDLGIDDIGHASGPSHVGRTWYCGRAMFERFIR